MTTPYTDDQACIEGRVENGPWQHRKTIPAWAARSSADAAGQIRAVRAEIRAEVGPGIAIDARVIPGYCQSCRGKTEPDPLAAIAVMIVAIAAANGYAEATGRLTSTEVREAWATVLKLATR